MQENVCEALLEKLCSAVQKIQEEFASGSDIIKDSDAVHQLCQSVDDILSHGLKEGLLKWASGSEATYWPIASRITYREVVQDILSRQELRSDRERCQTWVRLAVQENALGSYLNVITQDEKLQREFYQPRAFVCDAEKVETAKTALLYGLSHLDFSISISTPQGHNDTTQSRPYNSGSFNAPSSAKPVAVNGYSTSSHSYTEQGSLSSASSLSKTVDGAKKKKRKKKSAGVAVIADSWEDGCGMLPSIERYLSLTEKDLDERDWEDATMGRSDDGRLTDGDKVPSDSKTSKNSVPIPVSEEELLSTSFSAQTSLENDKAHSRADGNGMHSPNELSERECTCRDTSNLKLEHENECYGHDGDENITRTEANTIPILPTTTDETEVPLASKPADNSSSQSDNGKPEEVDDSAKDVEYRVSHAVFEFGTPKEVSYDEDPSKDGDSSAFSNEEGEDLNFVPGIHKTSTLSRSSSGSSFTGSGSFGNGHKPVSDKPRRSLPLDSSKPSSNGGSLPSESWKYVTNYFISNRKDSRVDNASVTTEDSLSELGIFDELLGIEEDHFSPPESFMGFTSSEELQNAIHSCKDMIRKAPEKSAERKKLVEKLVQLRVRLQETKDSPSDNNVDTKKVLGHHFVKEQGPGPNSRLCDRCGKWIWTMWQSLFTCQACKFHSHRNCLHTIRRPCASRKVSMVSSYCVSICPESGLSTQQYKCAECRKRISLNSKGENASEARLCDYSGHYFCEECHWNDQMPVPARIVHNWDFTNYKVARQNKQLLSLMFNKPQMNLEQLNPALFKFVGELREIKRLREEILTMKKYFMSCRAALESKLLLHLQDRQHFVDNSYQYSLQDLIDVERGSLLPFVTRVHSLFLTHIKTECELCQAKGFVCELCKAEEIIFAFDPHAVQCAKCRTVLHKVCLRMESCPKCERRQRRSRK